MDTIYIEYQTPFPPSANQDKPATIQKRAHSSPSAKQDTSQLLHTERRPDSMAEQDPLYILPCGFMQLSFVDACKFAGRAAFLLQRKPRLGRHECVQWVVDARGVEPSYRELRRAYDAVNDINNQMRRSLIIHISEAIVSWFATEDGIGYSTRQPFNPVEGARNDALSANEKLQLGTYLQTKVKVSTIWRQALDYFSPAFLDAWEHEIFPQLGRVTTYMALPLFAVVRRHGLQANLTRYRFEDDIYRRLDYADRLTMQVDLPSGMEGRRAYNAEFPGLGRQRRTFRWLEALEGDMGLEDGLMNEFAEHRGPANI